MESHLLQMRGLKHPKLSNDYKSFWSHLLQMRGLKPVVDRVTGSGKLVASFTDAWIETINIKIVTPARLCRIFYRCVD